MKSLIIFLLFLIAPLSFANNYKHPADEAFDRLQKASKELRIAEGAFLEAVKLIHEKERREEILQAYAKRKKAWEALAEADMELQGAASGLPDTSTTYSLIPERVQCRYFIQQTKQLKEQTEWIISNWKRTP